MSRLVFVPVKVLQEGIWIPLRNIKDPKMYTTLEYVGIICLSVVGFQAIRVIAVAFYNHVLGPLTRKVNLRDMGPWAVVTGATDGLGKAYAEALSKHGVNIILISRNKTKLQAEAARLENEFHIHTKIIDVDFTDDSVETYSKLEKTLWPMEIGILINNVGLSNPHPAYFLDLPDKEAIYSNILKCNITAMTNMTQIVLPKMVERRKGIVVNISSTAAIIPSPLLAVYGASKAFQRFGRDLASKYSKHGVITQCLHPGYVATKGCKISHPVWMAASPEELVREALHVRSVHQAYIKKFTKDLASEYSKHGIIIQCIMPGFVATNMSRITRPSWMAPTPDRFVKDALRTIGIQQETTGYFPHSLMVGVIHCIQSFAPTFMTWVITRTMETIRRRALLKQQASSERAVPEQIAAVNDEGHRDVPVDD